MKRAVRYRLEIDYYFHEYPGKACSVSSPVYTLKEGKEEYKNAIEKGEKCLDDPSVPACVHLWKYSWDENGRLQPITIMKNY